MAQNHQRPPIPLKIQETYCLPCIREAKKIDLDNVTGKNDPPKEVPAVGLAVTWEIVMDGVGRPIGPYPVCSSHVTLVEAGAGLLKG